MDFFLNEPLAKRPRLDSGFPPEFPDELLAKILNFVDEPWLKICCMGLNIKFSKVLQTKEAWNSTEVHVKLVCDRTNLTYGRGKAKSFELNGRRFDSNRHSKVFSKFFKIIGPVKSFSFDGLEGEDLTLIRALFGRIIRVKTVKLKHFSFSVKRLSQLKPLPDFLLSCRSTLLSFSLTIGHERYRCRQPEKPFNTASIWNALKMCTELKHFVANNTRDHHDEIENVSINSALSQMPIKTLELHGLVFGNEEAAINLIKTLPSLEKLRLSVNGLNFVEASVNELNVSPSIKELGFLTMFDEEYEEYVIDYDDNELELFLDGLDLLFPNLNTLSMPGNDPVPIIDHIFNKQQPGQPPFVLIWSTKLSVAKLSSVFEKAVINKGGHVLAAQSKTCIFHVQRLSPYAYQHKPYPVYLLVRNKVSLIFYARGSWTLQKVYVELKTSDCLDVVDDNNDDGESIEPNEEINVATNILQGSKTCQTDMDLEHKLFQTVLRNGNLLALVKSTHPERMPAITELTRGRYNADVNTSTSETNNLTPNRIDSETQTAKLPQAEIATELIRDPVIRNALSFIHTSRHVYNELRLSPKYSRLTW